MDNNQIRVQLDQLAKAIYIGHEVFDDLNNYLDSIRLLGPEKVDTGVPETEATLDPEPMSALAMELKEMKLNAENLNRRITTLRDEIDL